MLTDMDVGFYVSAVLAMVWLALIYAGWAILHAVGIAGPPALVLWPFAAAVGIFVVVLVLYTLLAISVMDAE